MSDIRYVHKMPTVVYTIQFKQISRKAMKMAASQPLWVPLAACKLYNIVSIYII